MNCGSWHDRMPARRISIRVHWAFLAVVAVVSSGCGHTETVSRVSSPDGKWRAEVEKASYGGATTPYYWNIWVADTDARGVRDHKCLVALIVHIDKAELSWAASGSIEVLVDAQPQGETIKINEQCNARFPRLNVRRR